MTRFRVVLCLQIVSLVFADDGQKATTAGEHNTTISSSEKSTKPEKQGKEILNCEKNLNPSFMIVVRCVTGLPRRDIDGLILSDNWVLTQASTLRICLRGDLETCVVGNGEPCGEIIVHENYKETYEYNLGLVSTKHWSIRGSWVLSWPEVRGFTDACTKLVLYRRDPNKNRTCTTMKVVGCQIDAKNEGFLCTKVVNTSDPEAFRSSFAVCNSVVVGISTVVYGSDQFVFTKIEAYYTFIRKITGLKVPFEASPEVVEGKTEEPRPTGHVRRQTTQESTRGSESTGRTEGPKGWTEGPTRAPWTQEKKHVWRRVSNRPEYSKRSSANSFKQSTVLLFLSILVPLLLKLLCQ